MKLARPRLLVFAAAAAVALFAPAGADAASGAPPPVAALPVTALTSTRLPSIALPPTGSGVDVSFPQCAAKSHVDLPASVPFAVVGVNGGVASNSNPCFLSEFNSALLLAGSVDQPHAALYVNTGNPSLAATWWPSDDTTQSGTRVSNPNGACTHLAGASCAYIYGYSMAQADYRRARTALVRVPRMWWLDVETSNSWQPDVVANSASLIGMVDYFEAKGLDVGIYSTSYQWGIIAGATLPASHLAGLPSWLAGGSAVGAPVDCEKNPLTPNGRVAMVQYVTNLDNDYACQSFAVGSATIAPHAPSVVGTELTASAGHWGARDIQYAYQWNDDGVAIPGATGSSYVTGPSDVGATVSVTITGTKPGYSLASRTSDTVSVLGELAPGVVTITGTASVGQTLTATTVAWGPAPVTLAYRWYRGSKLVSSGPAAATFPLTGADAGNTITVRVTGSEPGYASASESATTAVVSAG